jgi:hypothetical protein
LDWAGYKNLLRWWLKARTFQHPKTRDCVNERGESTRYRLYLLEAFHGLKEGDQPKNGSPEIDPCGKIFLNLLLLLVEQFT